MTWWSSEELTSKQEGTEGFSPHGVYSLFVRVNRPNLIFWTPSRFLSSRISCLVREKVRTKRISWVYITTWYSAELDRLFYPTCSKHCSNFLVWLQKSCKLALLNRFLGVLIAKHFALRSLRKYSEPKQCPSRPSREGTGSSHAWPKWHTSLDRFFQLDVEH